MPRPLSDWYTWARRAPNAAAIALVAAGVVPPDEDDADEATWALMRAFRDEVPPLLSHLPTPWVDWRHHLSPDELRAALETALQRIPRHPHRRQHRGRVVLLPARGAMHHNDDWLASFEEAVRRDVGAEVVFHGPARGSVEWAWPVRIGVFPDAHDLGGFGPLIWHWWNGKLFHLTGAGYGSPRFDLLLVHGEEGVEALLDAEVEATAVVLLDEAPATTRACLDRLDLARRRASAAFAATAATQWEPARWLYELITKLSHGVPLDSAVRQVGRAGVRILADRKALPHLDLHASTARQLERLAAVERATPEATRVRLMERLTRDLQLETIVTMHGLGAALRSQLPRFVYDQESGGATTIGGTFATLEDARRRLSPGMDGVQRRRLRARIADWRGQAVERMLAARTHYVCEVSVGSPAPGWQGGGSPFVEPEGPPDTPAGWRLRVVVREPKVLPRPTQAWIVLPSQGASTVASFIFSTADDPGPFAARISVLQGSRVLQTGVLSVDADGARFRVDAAPEPRLSEADAARWASVSLVLNNDATGTPTLTAVHGKKIGVADLPAKWFDDFTARVSTALGRIAAKPQDYTALDAPGTRALLISLAMGGAMFRRALIQGAGLDSAALQAASRIQIVSTKAGTFFPAEFIYDLPLPRDDAALCPGAVQALQLDQPCTAAHTPDTVCPTGFWSLSKVIERHAHVPANNSTAGPFTLFDGGAASVHLDPYRHVLYAAADRADQADPNATRAVEDAARRVATGVDRVADWKTWETVVGQHKPSLLLLLPHHEAGDKLVIGSASSLSAVDVTVVRAPDAPDAPLVLLIGCETLLTREAFNDFVQNFLWCGAKTVVATYGTVLGRHASPATVKLLDGIADGIADGSVRLGAVVRNLKRQLLLDGQPMVLGLTSHGDADLLLER